VSLDAVTLFLIRLTVYRIETAVGCIRIKGTVRLLQRLLQNAIIGLSGDLLETEVTSLGTETKRKSSISPLLWQIELRASKDNVTA
jgi:hypothetical protein